MYIGSGVVIGSGATMGAGNAAPSGNIVFQYVMGNSISFNGQGFDLSYGNFSGPLYEANGSQFMFDTGSDYANGAYGNFGVYTAESGNTNVTAGNIFVNHGPLSYLTFDGGANGQYVDSTFVGATNIPSGSSFTYFAVVRVNSFADSSNNPTGAIVGGDHTFFGFLPPNTLGPDNYPLLIAGIGAPQCGDNVTQFQPNTWYAVAVTYDSISQVMTVYTNGVAVTGPGNPATGVAPFSGNEPLYWGTWEGSDWLNGDLAVMTAWSRALSGSEIAAYTTEYGAPYGITVSRPDNDMPLQTFSQLFSVPGEYTFNVPYGVSNVSIVTVGAGGGGSRDGYSPPGGDTYVISPWNSSTTNMNTNGAYSTAPFITFDCSSGNNAAILGNVEPGWLLTGNDFNTTDPNRALIQGNVYGIVTTIDSSNVSNVVIGVYPNVTSTSGGIYNFLGNVIVGAQGGFEAGYQYTNNTVSGPGPRAMGINADGFGAGGVVDYLEGDALGGGGAGGYGTNASVVAFDPNQTFVYDNNGDLFTGTANVVLELTNNNLTVAATANNASYPGIATGTYTITGEKVMFSLTVNASAGSGFQGIGFGNTEANIYSYVGSDIYSGGFYNDGNFYYSGSPAYTGYPTFTTGDIVDIAIDNSNSLGQVAFYRVNGGDWLGNPSSDPVTSTNGVTVSIAGAIYLMTTQGDQTSIGQWSINTSNTYATPSGYTFIGGLANAGSTGGDGAGYSLPTNKPGQGDGSTIGGSGGGGGGIVYNTGSGGGGVGLYGLGSPGIRGGWVNENQWPGAGYGDNTLFANGAGGGSSIGNSGTVGGVASNWAGGAGGWPGGGGGSGTDYYGASNGGALAYKNNVTVTPGQNLSIIVGQGGYGGGSSDDTYYSAGVGAGGAVRIVWPGDTRQFPGTNVDADITGGTAFTINAGDFTYSGSPASSISVGSGSIGNHYIELIPANATVAQSLFAFLREAGVYTQNSLNNGAPNNPNVFNAYIYNVSWAAGSTVSSGLVRMSYYAVGDDGSFYITTVDPTDTAYQTANPANSDPGSATLPGTFNFPATFTLYSPTTESGGDYWC